MAIWRVKTCYRKSCEQIEYFYHKDIEGRLAVGIGFRTCEYDVVTSDQNPPEFEFKLVPGGDGKKDSIDLNNCVTGNIVSSELFKMLDGGHWLNMDYPKGVSKAEQKRLHKFVEENGSYALEETEGWTLDETEVWVWGPIQIANDKGEVVRIIAADDNGNVIDHVED